MASESTVAPVHVCPNFLRGCRCDFFDTCVNCGQKDRRDTHGHNPANAWHYERSEGWPLYITADSKCAYGPGYLKEPRNQGWVIVDGKEKSA